MEMQGEKREQYAELLEKSITRVVKELSGQVEKISIFGAYPKRGPDLFTDLDILVI